MSVEIPLGDLAMKISDATGAPPPGGYRRLLAMAMDARLPGARRNNGRWTVQASALPEVIKALGLTPADRVAA